MGEHKTTVWYRGVQVPAIYHPNLSEHEYTHFRRGVDAALDGRVTVAPEPTAGPRVFQSGDDIPADVTRVKTDDGYIAERTHSRRGWQLTKCSDGTTFRHDLDRDGWIDFAEEECPLTEIPEDA